VHSQYDEEKIIIDRFGPDHKGSYLDIGAGGPIDQSNTYACYQRGWRGLAVEPQANMVAEFRRVRPRAPWLDNRLYARKGCMECWARYLCGGGCRMDSLLHLAEIHQPCPWECEFKRLLCRVALWIDRELKHWEAAQ